MSPPAIHPPTLVMTQRENSVACAERSNALLTRTHPDRRSAGVLPAPADARRQGLASSGSLGLAPTRVARYDLPVQCDLSRLLPDCRGNGGVLAAAANTSRRIHVGGSAPPKLPYANA
jgi:hypothetical protein